MELRTELKKDLNKVMLRIKYEKISEEDYQIHMLRNHELKGLLNLRVYGEGEETIYEYDISEMVSLNRYYKHRKMTGTEMKDFLRKIQEVMDEIEDYLLNPNRLLLDPEYIFLYGDEYRFCYFPKGEDDIRTSFHTLMDSFVKWTDYEDIASVKTAFLLHKETMEENYSLKGIEMKLGAMDESGAEAMMELPQEEKMDSQEIEEHHVTGRREKSLWQTEVYDERSFEWMNEQRKENRIMEEKVGLFHPMKRLLSRRRRAKWGEWDDLYMEEEEM